VGEQATQYRRPEPRTDAPAGPVSHGPRHEALVQLSKALNNSPASQRLIQFTKGGKSGAAKGPTPTPNPQPQPPAPAAIAAPQPYPGPAAGAAGPAAAPADANAAYEWLHIVGAGSGGADNNVNLAPGK
jgi:hypothetical protein